MGQNPDGLSVVQSLGEMSGLQTFIVLGNQDSLWEPPLLVWASQVALAVKNPPADARDIRDMGLIPGMGRSQGGEHSNPLQYSCLENLTDRGVLWATQSQTQLKRRRSSIACLGSDEQQNSMCVKAVSHQNQRRYET